MTDFFQQVANALSSGATYALLALGLAIVFNILGLVNFAHGELVTVSCYGILFLQGRNIPFLVQAASGVVLAAVAAILMERVAFRPLRSASFATLLLASFALSAAIQGVIGLTQGERQKGVVTPKFLDEGFVVAGVRFSNLQVVTIVVTAILLAALSIFLRRTNYGLAMRAAAQDFPVARLVGVNANRVIVLAFAMSGAAAGVAGILILCSRGTVEPSMGFTPVLQAFVATVIGGLGSIEGAVLGGFVLGTIEVALDALLPTSLLPFSQAFTLLSVVAILYLRPQGILGREGRQS